MINKWDLKTIYKGNQSKMSWLDNYNKPIILSPITKGLIKSMEKDTYPICQLNEIDRRCAEISSKKCLSTLADGAKKRVTTIIEAINSNRP